MLVAARPEWYYLSMNVEGKTAEKLAAIQETFNQKLDVLRQKKMQLMQLFGSKLKEKKIDEVKRGLKSMM